MMQVKVIEKHEGEGEFPTFSKGTPVALKEACTHFFNWYACEIEGYQTYVPITYINMGKLIRTYNPTELNQEVGDILEVKEIVNAWLMVYNGDGETGWIPVEKVVSMSY